MTNYTADQLALQSHLEAEAAKSAAWAAEEEGRWACSYTSDLDHWASMDVYSIEDLHRYDAIVSYSEAHKEIYGFRGSMDYDAMSTAEIQAEVDEMYRRKEEDRLWQESRKLEEKEAEKDAAADLGVSLETYLRWQEDAGHSTSRTPQEEW